MSNKIITPIKTDFFDLIYKNMIYETCMRFYPQTITYMFDMILIYPKFPYTGIGTSNCYQKFLTSIW